MNEAFARKWFGLRFVTAEDEATYRAWGRVEAAPYVRFGMIGSLLSWFGIMVGAKVAAPELFEALSKWMLLVVPAIVVALAVTWFPRLYGGLHPLTAFANAAAG